MKVLIAMTSAANSRIESYLAAIMHSSTKGKQPVGGKVGQKWKIRFPRAQNIRLRLVDLAKLHPGFNTAIIGRLTVSIPTDLCSRSHTYMYERWLAIY